MMIHRMILMCYNISFCLSIQILRGRTFCQADQAPWRRHTARPPFPHAPGVRSKCVAGVSVTAGEMRGESTPLDFGPAPDGPSVAPSRSILRANIRSGTRNGENQPRCAHSLRSSARHPLAAAVAHRRMTTAPCRCGRRRHQGCCQVCDRRSPTKALTAISDQAAK
jgi:hypothetical protein